MKTQMRCCKKCGCYLPDHTTLCLACGYDEAPKQEPAGCQDTGCWNAFGEWELLQSSIDHLQTQRPTFTSACDAGHDAYYRFFTGSEFPPVRARDGDIFYDLIAGVTYQYKAETGTWVVIGGLSGLSPMNRVKAPTLPEIEIVC